MPKQPQTHSPLNSADNDAAVGKGMKADRWRDTKRENLADAPSAKPPLIRVQTLTGQRREGKEEKERKKKEKEEGAAAARPNLFLSAASLSFL